MVYCIGLTGDIASGKTTAANLFSQLGIEVIHADQISRELTQNPNILKKIVNHYGLTILNQDNELNRKELRSIIFANPKERVWLESLLHPLIREEIKRRVAHCITPYCIVEIPLLITKENYPYINRILLMTASLETQIMRVMQRDHCSKKQALAILDAQPDKTLRLKNTDDLIINDLDIEKLSATINKLHHKYLKLSLKGNERVSF